MGQKTLYVKGVFLVIIRCVAVEGMLGKIIFVGQKRADAAKLQDCLLYTSGMQLLDTGFFLPVFVVMGVLFGGKLLDFRLHGFMAWQLGNAMRPKITGGCVRYDKIAFVPFPVGAAGFLDVYKRQPDTRHPANSRFAFQRPRARRQCCGLRWAFWQSHSAGWRSRPNRECPQMEIAQDVYKRQDRNRTRIPPQHKGAFAG